MKKNGFYIIIAVVAITFGLTMLIKYYRPPTAGDVSFDDFPLEIGGWRAYPETVSNEVLQILNPQAIFAANYVNADGVKIHLLFDFFSSEATFGGPHSPRNCLPGSGWKIEKTVTRPIDLSDREFDAGRFILRFEQSSDVMDFWYVTHLGETANDYTFKMYELISALTFKPRDIAFIRFVADNDPESLAALDQFQKLMVPEIYKQLPFEQ